LAGRPRQAQDPSACLWTFSLPRPKEGPSACLGLLRQAQQPWHSPFVLCRLIRVADVGIWNPLTPPTMSTQAQHHLDPCALLETSSCLVASAIVLRNGAPGLLVLGSWYRPSWLFVHRDSSSWLKPYTACPRGIAISMNEELPLAKARPSRFVVRPWSGQRRPRNPAMPHFVTHNGTPGISLFAKDRQTALRPSSKAKGTSPPCTRTAI
jgi:hypothetical protein